MQCPQCQHASPVEANFCLNCGHRLAKVCPQCQQVLPPEANFCMACGHNLATAPRPDRPETQPPKGSEPQPLSYTPPYLAEKILTSRRALEGERKQVTVMFAGIKDSTELIRDLDPEAAQQLLDPAIHLMRDAEQKQLLQTAAVIGTDVPLSLLQVIADLPEDALQRGLAHLQTAEFVYETQLFPECRYTFKHALAHEVAYGSLLQERRRALHARIVEALETRSGDRLTDHIERLAHHAFRGEVWDKALTYFRQAGTKAMARSACHEAVVCYEQALVAVNHLPEHRDLHAQAIDLRLELCRARLLLDNLKGSLNDLRAAERLAQALDDAYRLGRVWLCMARHFLENLGLHCLKRI